MDVQESPLSTKSREILRRNGPIAETVKHVKNGLIRHISVVPARNYGMRIKPTAGPPDLYS